MALAEAWEIDNGTEAFLEDNGTDGSGLSGECKLDMADVAEGLGGYACEGTLPDASFEGTAVGPSWSFSSLTSRRLSGSSNETSNESSSSIPSPTLSIVRCAWKPKAGRTDPVPQSC